MQNLSRGGYILSFFADSVEDLESISHGQKFVTKNGTDYGVPQAGSTVIVTSPNSGKTTYVMDAESVWVVTEDISYSAVVANPSDAATAKLEKLKVNDTTYANWTESEIKALAGGGGGKFYKHVLRISDRAAGLSAPVLEIFFIDNNSQKTSDINLINTVIKKAYNYRVNIPSGVTPFYYECNGATCDVSAHIIRVYYFNKYPFNVVEAVYVSIDLSDPNFAEEVIEL